MTQRDINKIDKTIMENFYKLVHSQQNVRVTAASSTFKILKAMKNNKDPSSFNINLNYSVDRLVSGLASSRALARQGYGTLLLEILNTYQVSTERLFNIAQQKFGHISKETSLDNLLAYFLLISIVLQSGNHKRSKSNTQYLEKIYNILLQLHNTKSYLGYSVCKTLVDYYDIFYCYLFASIPQHAFGSDAKLTTLELLTISLCNKKEPIRELISIDKSRLLNYCTILQDEKFQRKPLHPIFIEVSAMIIRHFPDLFKKFYHDIIFPTFFRANHNELAAMGLELISNLLRLTNNPDIIETIFDNRMIRTIIVSMRNRTQLSTHSRKFIDSLKEHFETDKENCEQYLILRKLTSPPGSIAFDEDSKSSSISDLLNKSRADVLKRYLDYLISSFYDNSRRQDLGRIQKACANQIAFVVSRPQVTDDFGSLNRACKFLMANSLFRIKDDKTIAENVFRQHNIPKLEKISEKMLPAIKSAYHSTLEHIVSICTPIQRVEQLDDLVKFANELISIDNLDHNECHNVKELWSEYMHNLKQHKVLLKKQEQNKDLITITSLFLFYGLQIIEYGLDCKTQLEELTKSCKKEEFWADILTDQLIAILSATECSSWIRKLCESVFGSLLSKISDTSIQLICDAIRAPIDCDVDSEELSDDDDDDVMSDSDSNSEGSFVEENNYDGEVDEHNTDLEISNDEENNPIRGNDNEKESDSDVHMDFDNDSDEEDYLNDEQMMKLDTVIADMFRLNRVGKKNKIEPAFQLRCLDLIKKLIIKKHNDIDTINTILNTIIPLAIKSVKNKETKPISDKIVRMLIKMPGKNKFPILKEFLDKQNN